MHDEVVVEPDLAGHRPRRLLGQGHEDVGRGGVGAALEQAGQQEVTLLPPHEVLLVLGCLAPGQQLLGLELDEDGRDEQELRELVEVDHVPLLGQDAHEAVDHGQQGDVEDIHLVGGHEVEQEIDRDPRRREWRPRRPPADVTEPAGPPRAPRRRAGGGTRAPYHGAP